MRPPSSVVVRPGLPSDHGDAFDLWHDANTARRGGSPAPIPHHERVLGGLANPTAILLMAMDDDTPVGFALGFQARDADGEGPPIPGLCHISMIMVSPTRWGQRVGTALVTAILKEARARGFERAQLWTHLDNVRGQRLYARLGFVASGREKMDDGGEMIMHLLRVLG